MKEGESSQWTPSPMVPSSIVVYRPPRVDDVRDKRNLLEDLVLQIHDQALQVVADDYPVTRVAATVYKCLQCNYIEHEIEFKALRKKSQLRFNKDLPSLKTSVVVMHSITTSYVALESGSSIQVYGVRWFPLQEFLGGEAGRGHPSTTYLSATAEFSTAMPVLCKRGRRIEVSRTRYPVENLGTGIEHSDLVGTRS
ncbi:hypothetical protein Cgig2_026626 [Carnegiea gigantea]|uniref:Uncharacterized protein n=1 Tax=Carnegiea gigantea TaxID=171969 RepID=A0A9Q1JWX7_9CARY|nr:hypothetical protein Cgig2_026626 [Carnegiea gigantea]